MHWFQFVMMIITAIITKMHLLIFAVNFGNILLTYAASNLFIFYFAIVSDNKWNLIFCFVLRMMLKKKIKMVRLLILRRNEDWVDVFMGLAKFADFSQSDLAKKKSKYLIGLKMVFFDIDMSAKEDNILKRNIPMNNLIFIIWFIVCDINKGIDSWFLFYWLITSSYWPVWFLLVCLNSFMIFNEDLPVTAWRL